jgi:KUP system potassium uptake protein
MSKKARPLAVGLSLGAIGVVFGDIGTSPLYAVKAIFGREGHNMAVTQTNVYGVISLIIWSVFLVVSIKYLMFIMRASNKGEGGIMALIAKAKGAGGSKRRTWLIVSVGLIGVALFYGDSVITPAISVLSAVEGLKVVAPSLADFVIPTTLVIIAYLFWIQRYGTAWIGRLFGPIMLLWFVSIGAGGLWRALQFPDIFHALSPVAAWSFIIHNPLLAFVSMGLVVLAITGAEALYADMGHFGRKPIAKAWALVVFPALLLSYMGQGAVVLHSFGTNANPFIFTFPYATRPFVIVLAMFATLIASQSVISGAFSLTRQAIHLGFLPKMRIKHTSTEYGQVYLPFLNFVLFVVVCMLVTFFGSSERLAGSYGLAVSGTMAIDTLLFLIVMRISRKKSLLYIGAFGAVFLSLDLIFVGANIPKLFKGGWLPLSIAFLVLVIIKTWVKGQRIESGERRAAEGTLQTFVNNIRNGEYELTRIPGQAIYVGHHERLAPLALHAVVERVHALHEKIIIVTVITTSDAHVPETERAMFDDLGYDDGISHVTLLYGFHDSINVPHALQQARPLSPELDFDPKTASYFVSISKVVPTKRRNMALWRKTLYSLMYKNAISTSDYYKLPINRTTEIRSLIKL